jgi:hypothetical protein
MIALGVGWAVIIVAGVSVVHATRIMAIVGLQVGIGSALLVSASAQHSMSRLERIAVGAPLGFLVSLLSDQVVHAVTGRWWGWTLPGGVIPVAVVVAWRRAGRSRTAISAARSGSALSGGDQSWVIAWVTAGGLLILGGGWYWSSVVGMAVVSLLAVRRLAGSGAGFHTPVRRGATFAAVGFAVMAVVTRPATWWIEDSDFGFFEALATGFSRWGTAGDLLAVGYPVRYHWFVYGWTGLVDRLAGTPPWVVLSQAGLVIGALTVALQMHCILLRLGVASRIAGPAVVALSIFDTFDSWGSGFRLGVTSTPSQLVGFMWLFGLVLWWFATRAQPATSDPTRGAGFLINLTRAAGMCILLVGATGAKVSHGIAGLAFWLAGDLGDVARRRIRAWALALSVAVALVSVAGVYVFVFRGAGNLGRAWWSFPVSLQGELVDYPGWPVRLAGVVMLWGFAGAVAVGLVVAVRDRRLDPVVVWSAIATLLVGGLLSVGTVSVFGSQLYFLHSALWVALPVVIGAAGHALDGAGRDRGGAWLVIASASTSVALYGLIPNPNSGAPWAVATRLGASAAGLCAVVFVLIGGVARRPRSSTRLAWMVVASLLLHGIGVGVVNWVDGIRRDYPGFLREQDGRIGSSDLRAAAAWMRRSVPEDDVVGSNDERPVVAALARRRMLLQTDWLIARHTRATPARDAQFDERKALQREFAAAPSAALRDRLVAEGVGWFLVRLEPGAAWTSEVGTVRFTNAGYAVVELSGP